MKYLELYKRWAKNGEIPLCIDSGLCGGLCGSILYKDHEFRELFASGQSKFTYWAMGFNCKSEYEVMFDFNPIRQNIVLFLAAMNNEL